MESRKFTVYNRTRESTLSTSVASVNAALEPLKVLKVLIEGLPTASRTGLWLTNFKGVPVARTLSPFDLIYLDKDNRVLHGVELSRDGEFAPFKGRPSSALVLPSNSLSVSRTREGDQLELNVEEVEAKSEIASAAVPPPLAAAPVLPPKGVQPAPAEIVPTTKFFSPFPTPDAVPAPQAPPAPEQLRSVSPAPAEMRTIKQPEIDRVAPLEKVPAPAPVQPRKDRDFFTPGVRESAATPADEKLAASLPVSPIPERSQQSPVQADTLPSDSSLQISQPRARRAAGLQAAGSDAPALPDPPSLSIQEAPSSPETRSYPLPPKRIYSLKVRLLRWLFPHLVIDEPEQPPDRRRADRQSLAGLVAYYFTGGSPEPQRIGNISVTGFYLHTDERWMPGTVVRMTLQRVGTKGDDPSDTIVVNSRIVRWGPDGEGFEFILTDPDN